MIRKLAERLAKTQYVREAMTENLDRQDLRVRLDARMIAGLVLIGFSYLIGWPAVAALSYLAVYFQEPMLAVIGGPTTYGFSYIVFMVGAWFAGADHAKRFARYATNHLVRKLLRQGSPP